MDWTVEFSTGSIPHAGAYIEQKQRSALLMEINERYNQYYGGSLCRSKYNVVTFSQDVVIISFGKQHLCPPPVLNANCVNAVFSSFT